MARHMCWNGVEIMDQFPLKPFLDRVIVEVIPIEDYYEQSEGIKIDLDRTFSQKGDRGIIRSVSDSIKDPIEIGDVVQFDPDTAYAGLLALNPAHLKRKDKPVYLQIRVGDLLGKVLA